MRNTSTSDSNIYNNGNSWTSTGESGARWRLIFKPSYNVSTDAQSSSGLFISKSSVSDTSIQDESKIVGFKGSSNNLQTQKNKNAIALIDRLLLNISDEECNEETESLNKLVVDLDKDRISNRKLFPWIK